MPGPFSLSGFADDSAVASPVSAVGGRASARGVGRREKTRQRLRVGREETAHAGIRQTAVAVRFAAAATTKRQLAPPKQSYWTHWHIFPPKTDFFGGNIDKKL